MAKGTELGLRAKAAMDSGKLVDDATVLGMIRERLRLPDASKGFILDGFPRNIAQAEALQKLLARARHAARVGGAAESRSGHSVQAPDGAPDLPGLRPGVQYLHLRRRREGKHRLIQRPDDKEEVIGKRLEVYEAQTKPLIKYYEAAGLLRVVDADADVNTVFKNIEHAVFKPKSSTSSS